MMTLSFIILVTILWLSNALTITQLIDLRLESLRKFASIPQYPFQKCSTEKYIVITEYQFGNSGNHIIEFTHGVWLARKMNATLIVPIWMQDIFGPINTTLLSKHHCFTIDQTVPKGIIPIEVTSEESFILPKLFHDDKFIPYLPWNMSHAADELSIHFLKVYAAIWSSPLKDIRAAGEWIIKNHLKSLTYTSVHKRNMEGGCSKILAYVTQPSDYAPDEIPADMPEWKGWLARDHPLCSMPLSMVLEVQKLRHRNNSALFVAYDGAGDVENYHKHGAVFSNLLDKGEGNPPTHPKEHRKFVDMFIAMHGDLFILNPRSTFSWQVYLIRVCLALESVPIIKGNDVYMQKVPIDLINANRTMWVSWTSVIDAYIGSK